MLADADGNITDTYDYDAFGNIISQTGETENNYLYCGEQYDGTTGYYYLRARYMNPEIGRFITMDTYQGTINDPVSLHKYLYANANPVMNIDPSGNVGIYIETIYNKAILAIAATIFAGIKAGEVYKHGSTASDYFGGGNTEDILSGLGDGSIGSCDIGMMGEASVVSALVAGMGITKAALSAISTVQMNNPMSEFYRGLAVIAVFNSLTEIEFENDNIIKAEGENDKKDRSKSPPARRVKCKSKKEAYEKAKKAGKGKEPRHDAHDPKGPHYHPNVPNPQRHTPHESCSHDHYFY